MFVPLVLKNSANDGDKVHDVECDGATAGNKAFDVLRSVLGLIKLREENDCCTTSND